MLVQDIYPGPGSSSPDYLTNINGTLYFGANDGIHGHELWIFTMDGGSPQLVLGKGDGFPDPATANLGSSPRDVSALINTADWSALFGGSSLPPPMAILSSQTPTPTEMMDRPLPRGPLPDETYAITIRTAGDQAVDLFAADGSDQPDLLDLLPRI